MPSLQVHLEAGLGNRMFQYASAKGIARTFGLDFKVHTVQFCGDHNTNYDWFTKDVLRLNVPTKHWSQVCSENKGSTWEQPGSEELGYHLDKIDKSIIQDKVLKGYFQSDKYFRHIRTEVLQDFQAPNYITFMIQEFLHKFDIPLEGNNLCAIHFRFGNQLAKYKKHFINLTEYYKKALAMVDENDPIMIITEDPHGIQIVFPEIYNILLNRRAPVYMAPLDVPYCEGFHMYLMTHVKSVISSNSTFSWWGGWLNNRADKRVIIPSRMLNTNKHNIDMENATVIEV